MDADQLFNAGLRSARAGDYECALSSLRVAVSLGDQSPEVFRLIGKVHVHLGNLPEAEARFRKTLVVHPGDKAAAQCLAAVRKFRRVRRSVASTAVVACVAVVVVAAGSLWFSAQPARQQPAPAARAEVAPPPAPKPVIQPPPEPPPPAPKPETQPKAAFEDLYKKGVALAFKGDLEGALGMLKPLSGEQDAGQPLAGNVHFWMGRCLYELGRTQEALDHFRTVVERYPACPKFGEAKIDVDRCQQKLKPTDKH